MWKYLLDKENLKTNGLIVVLLAMIFVGYKILTNHFHDTDNVISENSKAYLQQAVSNEKFSNSVDRLATVIDKKLR